VLDIGADLPAANEKFRKLVSLHVRVMLLSDILATAGYTQGRATVTLLQALCGRSSNNVLLSLGSLHRSCLWENIVLKGDESPGSPDAATGLPSSVSPTDMSTLLSPAPVTAAASSEVNGTQSAESSSATPKPESRTSKHKDPKECNIRALKHLASQLPYALAPFYQGELVPHNWEKHRS
jgi:E3 ubiquitin-protein ligase HUWE1